MSTTETVFAKLEGASAAPVVPAESPAAQEPKPEVHQPVEGQLPVESQVEEPTSQATEPEIETEPNLEETPETSGDFAKYKPLFKEHPELRNIIGREKAFSELGQFSEVREIVQRIPSLADAEQLVNDSENKRILGQTFREDPATFVESLKESDPLAFQQFATQLPTLLAASEPELFQQQARYYAETVMNNVLRLAAQDGDQALYDAVQIVAQRGLQTRLGQNQPAAQPNSEVARLRQELDQRKQADAESSYQSFIDTADNLIINESITAIEASIKKALPDATQAQLQRMVNEAWDKTRAMIGQQPQLVAQIENYKNQAKKGRQGIAERQALVQYVTGRTKLIIPNAVKPVVSEWSSSILKLNQDKTDKQKAIAAKTKDVGTGPQGTTSSASANPVKAGQNRHVKDVFAEVEAGTYRPSR
jgi:hypothetical protein